MSTYEEKRNARIGRMRNRIERLRRFAETHDFSLFSEEKSGIPMGQPVLVGHHSERRHRRHLERLHRLVERGFQAGTMADRLEARLGAMERNASIQVDNPDAGALLAAKIERLEKKREEYKHINLAVRRAKGSPERLAEILQVTRTTAGKLLEPDFCGRVGIPGYVLTNLGAEIRRLKNRVSSVEAVQGGFQDYRMGEVDVLYREGQIQLHFPKKPGDYLRGKLKQPPLSMKWSRYSGAWVRKWTPATAGPWFQEALKEALS